jgi:hypothetical protein
MSDVRDWWVEQRKSALKKLSEELDEAEEIVRFLLRDWGDFADEIGGSDGGWITLYASFDSTELPRQTSSLKVRAR